MGYTKQQVEDNLKNHDTISFNTAKGKARLTKEYKRVDDSNLYIYAKTPSGEYEYSLDDISGISQIDSAIESGKIKNEENNFLAKLGTKVQPTDWSTLPRNTKILIELTKYIPRFKDLEYRGSDSQFESDEDFWQSIHREFSEKYGEKKGVGGYLAKIDRNDKGEPSCLWLTGTKWDASDEDIQRPYSTDINFESGEDTDFVRQFIFLNERDNALTIPIVWTSIAQIYQLSVQTEAAAPAPAQIAPATHQPIDSPFAADAEQFNADDAFPDMTGFDPAQEGMEDIIWNSPGYLLTDRDLAVGETITVWAVDVTEGLVRKSVAFTATDANKARTAWPAAFAKAINDATESYRGSILLQAGHIDESDGAFKVAASAPDVTRFAGYDELAQAGVDRTWVFGEGMRVYTNAPFATNQAKVLSIPDRDIPEGDRIAIQVRDATTQRLYETHVYTPTKGSNDAKALSEQVNRANGRLRAGQLGTDKVTITPAATDNVLWIPQLSHLSVTIDLIGWFTLGALSVPRDLVADETIRVFVHDDVMGAPFDGSPFIFTPTIAQRGASNWPAALADALESSTLKDYVKLDSSSTGGVTTYTWKQAGLPLRIWVSGAAALSDQAVPAWPKDSGDAESLADKLASLPADTKWIDIELRDVRTGLQCYRSEYQLTTEDTSAQKAQWAARVWAHIQRNDTSAFILAGTPKSCSVNANEDTSTLSPWLHGSGGLGLFVHQANHSWSSEAGHFPQSYRLLRKGDYIDYLDRLNELRIIALKANGASEKNIKPSQYLYDSIVENFIPDYSKQIPSIPNNLLLELSSRKKVESKSLTYLSEIVGQLWPFLVNHSMQSVYDKFNNSEEGKLLEKLKRLCLIDTDHWFFPSTHGRFVRMEPAIQAVKCSNKSTSMLMHIDNNKAILTLSIPISSQRRGVKFIANNAKRKPILTIYGIGDSQEVFLGRFVTMNAIATEPVIMSLKKWSLGDYQFIPSDTLCIDHGFTNGAEPFDTSGTTQNSVDPRTLLFHAYIPLETLRGLDGKGPVLDLALRYSPTRANESALGDGIAFCFSSFDNRSRCLSLSSGQSIYLSAEDMNRLAADTSTVLDTGFCRLTKANIKANNAGDRTCLESVEIHLPSGAIEQLTEPATHDQEEASDAYKKACIDRFDRIIANCDEWLTQKLTSSQTAEKAAYEKLKKDMAEQKKEYQANALVLTCAQITSPQGGTLSLEWRGWKGHVILTTIKDGATTLLDIALSATVNGTTTDTPIATGSYQHTLTFWPGTQESYEAKLDITDCLLKTLTRRSKDAVAVQTVKLGYRMIPVLDRVLTSIEEEDGSVEMVEYAFVPLTEDSLPHVTRHTLVPGGGQRNISQTWTRTITLDGDLESTRETQDTGRPDAPFTERTWTLRDRISVPDTVVSEVPGVSRTTVTYVYPEDKDVSATLSASARRRLLIAPIRINTKEEDLTVTPVAPAPATNP